MGEYIFLELQSVFWVEDQFTFSFCFINTFFTFRILAICFMFIVNVFIFTNQYKEISKEWTVLVLPDLVIRLLYVTLGHMLAPFLEVDAWFPTVSGRVNRPVWRLKVMDNDPCIWDNWITLPRGKVRKGKLNLSFISHNAWIRFIKSSVYRFVLHLK